MSLEICQKKREVNVNLFFNNKKIERELREHLDDSKYYYPFIYNNINDFSIDFLREIDRKIIKQVIMYSKEWNRDEEYNVEKHFKRCFSKLREFWREMIK